MYARTRRVRFTGLLTSGALLGSLCAVLPAAAATPPRHPHPARPAAASPVSIGTAVAYVRNGQGTVVAVSPTALPR